MSGSIQIPSESLTAPDTLTGAGRAVSPSPTLIKRSKEGEIKMLKCNVADCKESTEWREVHTRHRYCKTHKEMPHFPRKISFKYERIEESR